MAPPRDGFSENADRVYATDGRFARLYGLVRLEIHPDQYRHRMEWEARACVIEEYAGQIVPGLLQTEDYAMALFQIRSGSWDPAGARLRRLSSLTCGVVGYGRIGRATVRNCAASAAGYSRMTRSRRRELQRWS